MVGFRGSTQEKRHLYFFRFGYRKAVNDFKFSAVEALR